MSTELATKMNGHTPSQMEAYEAALMRGDLLPLSIPERLSYYRATCDSMGLNYLTKPFDWLLLQNKLTMYSNRNCCDQLRKIHGISCKFTSREKQGEYYIVTCVASDPKGRTDESTGVVLIAGLKGNDFANALMKAETKAKNRVTKSICGLGFLDESELDTVKDAQRVSVDYDSRQSAPNMEHGGTWSVVRDEVAQPPAPEEVPVAINGDPWRYALEGVVRDGMPFQFSGRALFEIPSPILPKLLKPANANKITLTDRAYIEAALKHPEGRELAAKTYLDELDARDAETAEPPVA